MVKFDLEVFKFLTREHFRVLTAIEMGMRNHELVPTQMIEAISGLKRGGAYRVIQKLHKLKFIRHDSVPYDGYTLVYRGYDYLAIKAMVKRGHIGSVGKMIGTGKESDVFEAFKPDGTRIILKLHRLGRISFQRVKDKRDYLGNRHKSNWLYVSRLSALREFAYMKALHGADFRTPEAIDVSRHGVLMSFVEGKLLVKVSKLDNPGPVYDRCMSAITRLAEHGLIHCDYNEFNLILTTKRKIWVIDFPQMCSTDHPNATAYFDRDVQCIQNWFFRKYGYTSENVPKLEDIVAGSNDATRLDWAVDASGVDGEAKLGAEEEQAALAAAEEEAAAVNGELSDPVNPAASDLASGDPPCELKNEDDSAEDDGPTARRTPSPVRAPNSLDEPPLPPARAPTRRRKKKSAGTLTEKEIMNRLKKKAKDQSRRRKMLKGRKTGAKNRLKQETKRTLQGGIW